MAEKRQIFTSAEAATYLGRSIETLANWRSHDQGPPYIKADRIIRYYQEDLDLWLQAGRIVPQGQRRIETLSA